MARIATLSRIAALLLAAAPCPAAEPAQAEIMARAAIVYAERLAGGAVDSDQQFTVRARAIAQVLIHQARRDYPETAGWDWEVHTTGDERANADCMAGGKILVSQAYAERLGLNDAELAMLLAHEIQHAALHHNLLEYQAALRLAPAWAARSFAELEDAVDNDRALISLLSATNYAQEQEADREGLRLAWRAGWPASQLLGYYRKMLRAADWPNRGKPDYPSPSQRWRAAQTLADSLQKNYVPLH
ncbi:MULTISPECIES: M48 family metalloprotease [unclassified Duganella]|uniref:M48 family metalloprotease n=1 Tax=unclassified Duganella TaxID=2636909 RepID=UPI0008894F91|nr:MULTISPECIES: M48 family metalloprotease [unclassified Duganella]SDH09373.1 Peptidase family M48 [Duganella sp. OV458]SDK16822.1 Peptidase family M48 [Duganella sp. OV510]